MSELMLINPRRRKRKMSAKQLKFFGKRRKKKYSRRGYTIGSSPIRRLKLNPKRRYRRNPSTRGFNIQSFAQNTLIPSAIGAAGALSLDVLLGFLPLPAAFKSGPMRPIVKLVGAVGIGMIAGMIGQRKMAEQVTAGAVTVVLYDTMKGFLQTSLPNIPLGDAEEYPALEYVNPAITVDESTGEYTDDIEQMSAYVPEF